MKNEKMRLAIVGCAAVMVGSMLFMLKTQNGSSMVSVRVVAVPEAPREMSESITTATITAAKAENKADPETVPEPETAVYAEISTEPLCININTADAEEFTKLDGIGEVTAGRIMAYRDINGGFNNIEELMLVDGIGEKTFAAIMDYVYVDDPVYPVAEAGTVTAETLTEPVTEVGTVEIEPPTVVPETTYVLTLEEICPIDLNTATAEELVLLPYVTEDIADRILELRRKIGGYSHPYELLYIDELEQNQVAEIIEFVIVGQ